MSDTTQNALATKKSPWYYWKLWLLGLLQAVISGAAQGGGFVAAAWIVGKVPTKDDWKYFMGSCAAGIVMHIWAYLKTSPIPKVVDE